MKNAQPTHSEPDWLYPVPYPGQWSAIIATPEADLPRAHRISALYALLRTKEEPRPARDASCEWAIIRHLHARILTPPPAGGTGRGTPTGHDAGIAHGGPNGRLAHANTHAPDRPPGTGAASSRALRPGTALPDNFRELTELFNAALTDSNEAETLARATMQHHRYQRKKVVGLSQEEIDRVAHYLEKATEHRLPGELRGGHAVFRITYEDGCTYTGFTAGGIDNRWTRYMALTQWEEPSPTWTPPATPRRWHTKPPASIRPWTTARPASCGGSSLAAWNQ